MHYTKLKISSEATSKLRTLKSRTGLTPNLLCRMALMYSLEEGAIEENTPLPNEDGSEFNAYTLTGDNTDLFLTLINYIENKDKKQLDNKIILDKMRSHIHRGVGFLVIRIKSPHDILKIIQ
ncbi:DNA sulfur modification protein DndE [Acinetobacter guillouiae MSP4-18]|uniref:DNA sulfur modification protein DndE n=1 Tax=Acinetobacter guillouiae TaxID=106649 RepID=UPI0002CFF25F|nr:DNA sulfur modification protein DndE [Acinetobacter guillouiae]ENU60075.1 DNA sulfur modification protein DndE [Acinetobacter guillouiae CIP 63.46]EPH38567.1 DNA sulfur modification protein DndE [Acinetobacter guillouiae MSP4-18]KAB0629475.1 DNA sulfur modification protein DndE [Acinetobacter guillouiae]